ncbi:MAG: hypothetical protein KA750_02425, partial [Thermoflexales bacterium]|nr:hypothetical protein [Thermoflexales bacterium]
RGLRTRLADEFGLVWPLSRSRSSRALRRAHTLLSRLAGRMTYYFRSKPFSAGAAPAYLG